MRILRCSGDGNQDFLPHSSTEPVQLKPSPELSLPDRRSGSCLGWHILLVGRFCRSEAVPLRAWAADFAGFGGITAGFGRATFTGRRYFPDIGAKCAAAPRRVCRMSYTGIVLWSDADRAERGQPKPDDGDYVPLMNSAARQRWHDIQPPFSGFAGGG